MKKLIKVALSLALIVSLSACASKASTIDEVVDALDSYLSDLATPRIVRHEVAYDDDIYTVIVTADNTASDLWSCVHDSALDREDRSEALDALRDYMGEIDNLSGSLKDILDQHGHGESGVMIHVSIPSAGPIPVHTSADGDVLYSYLTTFVVE